jgi:hypothetical protein
VTGRVLTKAQQPHRCSPGWTERPFGPGHEMAGLSYGFPPTPWDYPKGTVWECGTCGRLWVSLGAIYWNAPGRCDWRPMGRFERWRRSRGLAR